MNHYLRNLTSVFLIAAAGISLSGCGHSETLLYEPETGTGVSSAVTELAARTENLSLLHADIQDLISEYPMLATQDYAGLGFFCFTDVADAQDKIDAEKLPVQDGSLALDLNFYVYSNKETDYGISGSFVMFWNDQVCDFAVDGVQSKDGFLKMNLPYNQDVKVPFLAEKLPVQEGQNTFCFCFFPYCAAEGEYLTPQRLIGHYESAEARDGIALNEIVAENQLDPAGIQVATDQEEANSVDLVNRDDLISSESKGVNMLFRLRQNPTFYFNILNTQEEVPSNRSGIMMMLKDGELQPVWNGRKYAAVSLTDKELKKQIAVKTDYSVGEQHDLLMVYSEMQSDPSPYEIPLMYSDGCSCKIEE